MWLLFEFRDRDTEELFWKHCLDEICWFVWTVIRLRIEFALTKNNSISKQHLCTFAYMHPREAFTAWSSTVITDWSWRAFNVKADVAAVEEGREGGGMLRCVTWLIWLFHHFYYLQGSRTCEEISVLKPYKTFCLPSGCVIFMTFSGKKGWKQRDSASSFICADEETLQRGCCCRLFFFFSFSFWILWPVK